MMTSGSNLPRPKRRRTVDEVVLHHMKIKRSWNDTAPDLGSKCTGFAFADLASLEIPVESVCEDLCNLNVMLLVFCRW